MIVLAIDTCDSRGSVGLLKDEILLGLVAHESKDDYSSWLLPAVDAVLSQARLKQVEVSVYTVAAGPGSFTGVRVGLTTVKAWAEVYAKPVAAVSRLEAIAAQGRKPTKAVAAFVDAQRGQAFGAVYKIGGGGLSRIGEEMVIAPEKFIEEAARLAGSERLSWVSPDVALLTRDPAWKEREERGERIQAVSATLAESIGRIGLRHLREGKATNALGLDANYVRRSDAEIFWKDASPLSDKFTTNARHGK